MIDITGLRKDKRPQSSTIVHALLDRLEAAEKERETDEERIADLMADLNRVGHENDALRAKVEAMERQEPAGYGVRYVEPANGEEDWDSIWRHRVFAEDHIKDFTQAYVDIGEPVGAITVVPLYALPGAQPAPSAPSEEAAAEMGANGGHVVEAERLAFEAWMRGHCWELGAKWTGTEYRSAFEKGGMVDTHAMRTRELWAAWRDRAALAAPKPEAKP